MAHPNDSDEWNRIFNAQSERPLSELDLSGLLADVDFWDGDISDDVAELASFAQGETATFNANGVNDLVVGTYSVSDVGQSESVVPPSHVRERSMPHAGGGAGGVAGGTNRPADAGLIPTPRPLFLLVAP